VRFIAFGPPVWRSGLLTNGSHAGESGARISGPNVLSVAEALPARHSFGVFCSPCDYG